MVRCQALAIFLLGTGLAAQHEGAPALRPEPVQDPVIPRTVLIGSVSGEDGAPAGDAVVLTDAGGLARTDENGRFRLEVALPPDVRQLRLTALRTVGSSTSVARLAVPVRPGGTVPVGDLALATNGGCEPSWLPTFGHWQDLPQTPVALATWDDGSGPTVFAGCSSHAYRWNGKGWDELPGVLFGGGITSLVAFDDGAGSKLYMGGGFLALGGLSARGLARWDGSAWEILQPNLGMASIDVSSMEIYDDGGGAALFVAGDIELTVQGIPAHDVLRYDGTWSVPGTPPTGQRVRDLEVHDDGQGGGPELYASSTYDVGGTPTIDLARWNGSRWELLSAGFQGPGTQTPPLLKTFDDGLGGGPMLCAAGPFTSVSGVHASRVARWDGVTWTPLDTGLTFATNDLAAFDDGSGPGLYAGSSAGRVRRWDGTSWMDVTPPLLAGSVSCLEVVDDGSGMTLHVGGPSYTARWEGSGWAFPMQGVSDTVYALAVYDDGLGGGPALYAGGQFDAAGGQPAAGIAKWDGTAWSALGSGVGVTSGVASVHALAVFDDGGGPALVAGGTFTTAGGMNARRVAAWDGTSWSAFGSGLDDEVDALVVFDDGLGAGPVLHAGGRFTASGATPLAKVARWDGAAWNPLGAGMDDTVRVLAVHDDGLGGGPALYAGGSFGTAGGVSANQIARWDGIAWSPVGTGLSGVSTSAVECLLSFDPGSGPRLWAGGSYNLAGGNPATGLASWDGFTWSPLAGGPSGTIRALAAFDDGTGAGPTLHVAGSSLFFNGQLINGIARWDGFSWSPIPMPVLTFNGYSLLVRDGGAGVPALLVGGFTFALGGSSDSRVARWQGCASVPPTLACPDAVDVSTFSASGRTVAFEVSATGAGSPAPVVDCMPPSGSFFPLGTTMVHCTATDALGNVSTCDFPVHVSRRAQIR